MEQFAQRAPAAAREAAWFDVAKRAVLLSSMDVGERKDFEATRRILKNACERLPAPSLAAAAAVAQDPILSAAFARAIQRVDLSGRGGDLSGAAEAASECRDAIARFGPEGIDELLSIWKKAGRAGFAPGGASASVYRIVLVGEDFSDTLGTDRPFAAGFRAAVARAAGAQADRFEIDARGGEGDPHWRAQYYASGSEQRGAGVLVVASGDMEASLAEGVAGATGVVVVDARDPQRIEVGLGDVAVTGTYDPRLPETVLQDPQAPGVDDSLRYENHRSVSDDGPALADRKYSRARTAFVAFPVGAERARRLIAWLRTQARIDTIGVALPEIGGDVALARACTGLLRDTDDDVRRIVVPLRYSSGRRNYAPEVRRAHESGCKAIILCGTADESAEWLRALSASRSRMLVLGGSELDPSGLRDEERGAAEGAVYVDSNWRLAGALRGACTNAALAAGFLATDADFERGFITGTMFVRRIVVGNCSLGLLRDAFEDESPVILGMARTMLNPGSDPALPGSGEIDLAVQRIQKGAAIPIRGR